MTLIGTFLLALFTIIVFWAAIANAAHEARKAEQHRIMRQYRRNPGAMHAYLMGETDIEPDSRDRGGNWWKP